MESEANREQSSASPTANNAPSLSKSEAIVSLQQTIQQLEAIVRQLNNLESMDTVAIDSSVNTLLTTTKELATAITTPSITQSASPPQPPPKVTEQRPQTDSATFTQPEPEVVATPRKAQPKRNNRLIIGIISTVIIIGLGIFWWRLPEKPVALISRTQSPDTEIATDTLASQPEIIQPETYPEEIPDTLDEDTENLTPDIESEPEISQIYIPLELEAPAASKKLKIETVEPKIILTPEQNLIAAIQNRVTEITQDYAENSIVSVEADFRQGSLSVILSNLWYELSQSRQNKLANDLLKRSRQLDFQKLIIKDPEGTLIARSPVIGNSAIVIQRVRT
ncbi:MAG: hypothetical protein ACFCU5_15315 [Pleurocapsa sp.]